MNMDKSVFLDRTNIALWQLQMRSLLQEANVWSVMETPLKEVVLRNPVATTALANSFVVPVGLSPEQEEVARAKMLEDKMKELVAADQKAYRMCHEIHSCTHSKFVIRCRRVDQVTRSPPPNVDSQYCSDHKQDVRIKRCRRRRFITMVYLYERSQI